MTIETNPEEFLWVQKYRPKKILDTILPVQTKAAFLKFIEDQNIPNLILSGPPGTGKTTAAIAMLEELGCDYIKINGSLNGGIDTLRGQIANFASSVSFTGGRKYVIIDEADGMTPNMQTAFRSFVEDFSKNCGFIFTCNFLNKLIAPLRESRFSVVHFSVDKSEKPKLAAQFFKRTLAILEMEHVGYEPKVVAKVIEKNFPDFRRILGDLQKYASNGNINEGIFVNIKEESLDELFVLLKSKKFTEMRKWVADNSDQDFIELFNQIYRMMPTKVEIKSQPGFIIELGEYMYKHALVANPEINLAAFLTSVMFESSFT